jgi:molecular chaperone GrpE
MKKKMQNKKESEKKYFNKTTEDKENSNAQENETNINPDYSSFGVPEKSASADIETEEKSDKIVAEVVAAEEKLAEMQDKYIRLSAEFDNYRKRTLREKMDLLKYSGEDLLLKIIPLMDDFERALMHLDTASDCTSLKNGIDLIYIKFSDFLKQNGVKEIDSLNSNFNVDLHEAVAKVQVEDNDKKGKVVEVLQKGYYIQDKVLRFAKVVVGE